MSVNLQNHYVQQYSTNVSMLLANKAKLRDKVTVGTYVGEQASPVDQYGSVEMSEVTTRFSPKERTDVSVDRRWVFPSNFSLNQQIDSFDKLRLLTDPQSPFAENASRAGALQIDKLIINAFLATAKTGKSGSASTSFTSGNEVDVSAGGTNSTLTTYKLKALRELMDANFVDFEMETVWIGITAKDAASLRREIEVVSSEFYMGSSVMKDGKIPTILGFNFVQSELFETLLAGTNEVTLPVWCQSGMHLGIWGDVKNNIHERHDLEGDPWEITTTLVAGATRLEEDKVYSIESYRA